MLTQLARNRLGFALVGITLCLLAYFLGTIVAKGARQPILPDPLPTFNGLFIDPKQLDLGEIWATPNHTFSLTIQNLANSPRTITRFQTTCNYLQLEPEGRTLVPGEKAEFSAKLLLLPTQPSEWGAAQWPKVVRLDPIFKENLMPTPGWQVTAKVRNRVGVDIPQLLFPDQCTHRGPLVWRKVRAKTYMPVKLLRANWDSKKGSVSVEKTGRQEGEFFIFVSPNPSQSIGSFRFDVELSIETEEGAVFSGPTIDVAGEIQPSTIVMPRVVYLRDHKIPAEAEADITLKLPANHWKIDHIETDSIGLEISEVKDPATEGIRLHLKQKITKVGTFLSMIKILVRKPDQEMETVPVEVRFSGNSR